jgi:hypothetical protein
VVLDVVGNRGVPGNQTGHTNTATLTFGGNPSNAVPSGSVVTRTIEPRLAIQKRITNHGGGCRRPLGVTLVITNSGLATAYDLAWRDVLNPLHFDAASVSNTLVPTGFVFSVETNVVVVRSDTNSAAPASTVEAGEGLVVRFDVTVSSNLPPNTVFTNTR